MRCNIVGFYHKRAETFKIPQDATLKIKTFCCGTSQIVGTNKRFGLSVLPCCPWCFLPPVTSFSGWNDSYLRASTPLSLSHFSHGKCVVTRASGHGEISSWATAASHIFCSLPGSTDLCALSVSSWALFFKSDLCWSNSSSWAGFWKLHLRGSLWAIKISSVVFNAGISEWRKCN